MSRLVSSIAALALLAACSKAPRPADDGTVTERSQVPSPPSPTTPITPPAREPRGTVYLATPGGEKAVSVEVARSEAAQARGLMYRQHLPPGDGMLFFMGEEKVHAFWMENTLIPLDIIFIGKDMKVVGVVENAEPRTRSNRFVNARSLYVLEVNGGWSKANGVGAGTVVRFEGTDGIGR
jgi:uncharacterized membrane protein (UPF0127 family)